MPKKSASRKKAQNSPPDDFAPPPPEMVADTASLLSAFADGVEKNGEDCADLPVEVPMFEGIGSQAALAVLVEVPNFDEAILSKLERGQNVFLMPEIAAMARAAADQMPRTEGAGQAAAFMTGVAILNALRDFVESFDDDEAPPAKQPTDEIYQLKITLTGVEPAIWRRIQIGDCTLADLHYLIQAAMGWEDAHMYEFQINRKRYVVPVEGSFWDDGAEDPNRVLLSEVVPTGRKQLKLKYQYDFGDDWWHEVRFEKRISPASGSAATRPGNTAPAAKVEYPICTEGEGACPPEDCGGPWGYLEMLEAIGDKDHPRYEEFREWLGTDFDPQAFSTTKATAALRKSAAYVEGDLEDLVGEAAENAEFGGADLDDADLDDADLDDADLDDADLDDADLEDANGDDLTK